MTSHRFLALRSDSGCVSAISRQAELTMLGGAVALVGIVLLLNWNLPYTAPGGRLHAPDPPTVRPLHEGIVEVDWNDIAGADRYALQFWRPTGWTDTTDPELGTSESLDGSRAIIGNLPNGTVFDTFSSQGGRLRQVVGLVHRRPSPVHAQHGLAGIPPPSPWAGNGPRRRTQRHLVGRSVRGNESAPTSRHRLFVR